MMGYTKAAFINMFSALAVVILLGVVLKFTLGKKSLAVRQIPLHIIGFTIITLEIIKNTYHICMGNWCVHYLPFHFCSFFLVWFGLALITRGRLRQLMYFCSLVGGIIMTVVLYFAPRIVLVEAAETFWDNFNHAHAFVFHIGVVAYWVWMLMLNVYQPDRHHTLMATALYTTFYFFVIAAAFIFHENYTDVLYSSLESFDRFRRAAGQFIYDTVLVGIGIGVVAGVGNLMYFITSKLNQHYYQHYAKVSK